MTDPVDTGMAAGAAAALLVPVLFFWLRSRFVKQVGLAMRMASGDEEEVVIEELRADEVPAAATPSWVVHTADTWTSDTTAARTRSEKKAARFLRKLTLTDLAFGLIYVGLPFIFGFLFVGDDAASDTFGQIIGTLFALVLWVSGTVRYLLFRRAFRAFNLSRTRKRQAILRALHTVFRSALFLVSLVTPGNIAGITYLPSMLRVVFGHSVRFFASIAMSGLGIFMALSEIGYGTNTDDAAAVWAAAGLLVASVMHIIFFLRIARRMRQEPGLKLLVLRVFNIDESSHFTFNGLISYWSHFGMNFTIVDRSILRGRNEANYTMAVFLVMTLIALVFIFAISLSEFFSARSLSPGAWGIGSIVLVLTLLSAWLIYFVQNQKLDRQFIRSTEQLSSRLKVMDAYPRKISMRFRDVHAMCYKNTWFPTVAEFARRADVVMIDLRGYSNERKGCQREVDFLFDAVPVNRILFLTDVADDLDLIEEMLADRYKELRRTSPNLDLVEPQLNIFLSQDNDHRDMQAIMDWLISAAAAHAEQDTMTDIGTDGATPEAYQPMLGAKNDVASAS